MIHGASARSRRSTLRMRARLMAGGQDTVQRVGEQLVSREVGPSRQSGLVDDREVDLAGPDRRHGILRLA